MIKWIGMAALLVLGAPVAAQSDLSNLASVSGTVSAPAPFQAAQVYFRNPERRMQYMVYTAGGKFHAVNLLPGNYEMRVEARNGLESSVHKVTLKAGQNAPVN